MGQIDIDKFVIALRRGVGEDKGLATMLDRCLWSLGLRYVDTPAGGRLERFDRPTWLEKQGEKRSKLVDFDLNANDSDLQVETYFIPNGFHAEIDGDKIVIKQGKQKHTDKVEPKFKVGDKVRSIIDGFECTIESIDNTCYYGDTTNFDIQDQDGWELVEPKPVTWSEEVEAAISLLKHIAEEQEKDDCPHNANDLRKAAQYLETCRLQSQWKPSDRHMKALYRIIEDNELTKCKSENEIAIEDLANQLEKLRKE